MARVQATPEELRKFAQNLKRFNAELGDMTSRLQGQFRQLGDTWRDQEHARFAQEFEQTIRTIQRFLKISEQHIPFLLKKAQRLEEYLRMR